MAQLLLVVSLAMLGVGLAGIARRWLRARLMAERLRESEDGEVALAAGAAPRLFVRRHWTLVLGVGLAAGLISQAMLRPPGAVAFGIGAITLALAIIVDGFVVSGRTLAIESELADAVDLMVASLSAGASLLDALELAVREAGAHLRPQLADVTGRIRLGDAPTRALAELAERVPLDSFRLFALTIAVNWEVGGGLAHTLSSVGLAVRDRLELARRVRAVTTQARLSVVGVLAITYVIAVIIWRSDPARMHAFVASEAGSPAILFVLVMQAIGLSWMARVSDLKP